MLLLALDTATPAVTVALHDGRRVVAEETRVDARRHGELLAPAIEAVLGRAGAVPRDLSHVAVGVGPGPFTGLRVGLVTAVTLGAALGVPVHGVCSLDALAAAARELGADGDLLVTTDARRREVYWARYANGRRRAGPAVARPAELAPADVALPTAGEGPLLYPDVFSAPVPPVLVPAAALARIAVDALGSGGSGRSGLLLPQPLYLRRPDAVPPGAPKRVLA